MPRLLARLRHWIARRRLAACLRAEPAETFLEAMLGFMKLALFLDDDYRRHVDGFDARFAFASPDGGLWVRVFFADGTVRFDEDRVPGETFDVTVTFRSPKALVDYLVSPKPDLLGALLRQDLTFEGNLNHLYRLVFLSRRLRRMALGDA